MQLHRDARRRRMMMPTFTSTFTFLPSFSLSDARAIILLRSFNPKRQQNTGVSQRIHDEPPFLLFLLTLSPFFILFNLTVYSTLLYTSLPLYSGHLCNFTHSCATGCSNYSHYSYCYCCRRMPPHSSDHITGDIDATLLLSCSPVFSLLPLEHFETHAPLTNHRVEWSERTLIAIHCLPASLNRLALFVNQLHLLQSFHMLLSSLLPLLSSLLSAFHSHS